MRWVKVVIVEAYGAVLSSREVTRQSEDKITRTISESCSGKQNNDDLLDRPAEVVKLIDCEQQKMV